MSACSHDEKKRDNIVQGVKSAYKSGDHPPRLNAYFAFLNKPWSCKNSKDIFDGPVKYITANGISQSYVFTAKLQKQYGQPNRVYGKVSVEYSPFGIKNDDSLWTEAQIYRYMNTLVLRRATPHVVTFVHELNCSFTEASGLIPRDIWDILYSKTKTTNSLFTKTGLRFLLTEDLANTLPLHKFLQTAKLQDKKDVYFQILWNIAVFMEVGFEHHDMQFSNILVTELPTETESVYVISSMKFQLKTRFFVRVFDFDQSTKHSTVQDPLIISNPKMCREGLLGENQYHFAVGLQRNEKYDLFKFLGSLRRNGNWTLFSRSLPDLLKQELEKPRKESTLFSSFDNPLNDKYKEFMKDVDIELLMLDVAKLGSGHGKHETWYLPSFFNVQRGQKRKAESQTYTSVKKDKQ